MIETALLRATRANLLGGSIGRLPLSNAAAAAGTALRYQCRNAHSSEAPNSVATRQREADETAEFLGRQWGEDLAGLGPYDATVNPREFVNLFDEKAEYAFRAALQEAHTKRMHEISLIPNDFTMILMASTSAVEKTGNTPESRVLFPQAVDHTMQNLDSNMSTVIDQVEDKIRTLNEQNIDSVRNQSMKPGTVLLGKSASHGNTTGNQFHINNTTLNHRTLRKLMHNAPGSASSTSTANKENVDNQVDSAAEIESAAELASVIDQAEDKLKTLYTVGEAEVKDFFNNPVEEEHVTVRYEASYRRARSF